MNTRKLAKSIIDIPGVVGIGSSTLKIFLESSRYLDAVPKKLFGKKVTPIVTGPIEALSLQGGLSISNQYIGAGTLGIVHDGYIITNAHVIALDQHSNFAPNSKVYFPGIIDGGTQVVGDLIGYVDIKFNDNLADNYLDMAVAKTYVDYINDTIYNQKIAFTPTGVREKDIVYKVGRTTGYTTGEVISTSASVKVHYEDKWAVFTDVIAIKGIDEAFMKPGDSGAIIIKDNKIAGIGFAGNPDTGYAFACKPKYLFPAFRAIVSGKKVVKESSGIGWLGLISVPILFMAIRNFRNMY